MYHFNFASILLIFCFLIQFIFAGIAFGKTNKVFIQEPELINIANNINATLPKQIDKDIVLTNVTYKNHSFIYSYKYINFSKKEAKKIFTSKFVADLKRNTCNSNMMDLIEQGIELNFLYYDKFDKLASQMHMNKEICKK